jgi:hypothetical protein
MLRWVVLLAFACAAPRPRPAPFRARPDSVAPGDLRGPFDGRVVDADTGRPVSGALVYGAWTFVEGFGLNGPAAFREHVTTTDSNGRYRVPRLGDGPDGGTTRLSDFQLVIYKKGYVAYRSDRRFDDLGTRTDFAQKNHRVGLERWRSDLSHVKHVRYLGGGPALAALTAWELPEAAAELSGTKPTRVAEGTPLEGALPQAPILAKDLLSIEDVKKVTGFEGVFEPRELGDEPRSEEYDNLHLRAKDKGEAYDVALRLWVLEIGAAQKHYGKLLQDLPNVSEKNELGDRSFRASSDAQDIFGVGWLDGRRGIVILLTCGSSTCRSHDEVLTLARTIKDRVDAMQVKPK